MKQIFKTLSISILTVLSISLNLYAVNSGDWTSFETIVADTASTDNIVLTGDIVFEMNSLSLGHNLEIDGGNFYLSGNNAFKGLAVNAKTALFRDIAFKDFYGASASVMSAVNNSSISFTGNIFVFDNHTNTTSNTFFNITSDGLFEHFGALNVKGSEIFFNNLISSWTDSASIKWTSNTINREIFINAFGGVIYAGANSKLNFNNSSASFSNNFRVEFSSGFIKEKVFINAAGGVIYSSNTELSFEGSSVFLKNNGYWRIAGNTNITPRSSIEPFMPFAADISIKKDIVSFSFSGGAVYLDFSTLTFRNGEIVFVDNAAKDSGGALFASRSKVDFENSLLIFYENKTFDWNGAALSISSGILSVKNSSAAFEENTAAVYGGAVFENEANGLFALSSASFLNNYASYGGGVFLGSSSLVFDKSAVSFASNSAQGGAAASISSSKISFENSNALFSSNTSASDGGSINAENNSLLSFSSSAISFEYNSAGIPGDGSDGNGGGGAVSLINSHFLIKTSSVIFNSNFASNGGSIYAKNSNIEIENSSLSFLNNTAKSMLGSSFYLDRSTLSFKNSNAFFNADFNNAVFGKNSKIILNNAENSQMNFNFNSNRTLPPLAAFADIYLTEYSDMEIAGTDIKIEGGIRLEKSAINASAQNIYISSLSIDRNSSFSLSNSAVNQRVIFEELNIDGLFALGLDLNTAHSDYIVSDKTEITSGSVLLIKADFIENVAESRIRIFHGSNFWGAFTTIESILLSGNKGGRLKYDAIYDYNSQTPGIDIDFKGYLFMQDIEGLSDAQKKTAQILDKVNFENNPSMNKEIAKPIFEMMSRGNEEGAIKSLSGVSGEFLANVLSANIVKNNMSRIYPNITNERTLFWSNFLFENAQYPKNLTQNGLGFIFGFNSLNESGNAAGFYISYENEKVSAYNDKAYLDSIGAGAYYAAFKKDISIKTHLGFDLQSFDIRRDIYGLNLKPQSAFYAYTFSAGALFQWDSDIFRFFTDLQYALRLNGEIDEENGSLSNLRIESKTADNLVLKIGNSFIETKKDRPFEASIRAYIGFNLLGAQQQYDMYFMQAQDFGTIKSKSKEEKLLFLGAIAAIKYNIGKNTALYLNFDANTDTQDSFKFYSSLGFSVSIGAKAKRQNFNQAGIDGAPQAVDLDGILRSFEKKISQEQGMLNAAQKNKTTTYRVPGTAFEEGDADLSESSLKTLQNLAAQLLAAEYKKIVIEGHTDSSEDTRGLSIRRAKAVFDALSAAGLPENRLDFEGYSDTDPIDNTDSPGGKIKNRRTDIVVTWN